MGAESQTSRDHLKEAMNETAAMRAAADHRSLDPALLDALEGADDESDAHAIRRLRSEARLLKKREQETRIIQARLDRQARRLGMENPRTQRTLTVLEERGSEMRRLGRDVRTRDASFGLRAMNHERAEAEKAELVRRHQEQADFARDQRLAMEAGRAAVGQQKAAAAWKKKERNRLLRQVLTGSIKRVADIKGTVTLLQSLTAPLAGGGGSGVGFAGVAEAAEGAEQQKKWRESLAIWEPMLREVEAGTVHYDPKSDWCKATYKGNAYYWKDVHDS